jgi:signal transduction histidine kinase
VRMAQARVAKDPSQAAPFLERIGRELTEASADLRELARGIHPAVLTERGLAPAIDALVSRAPVPVEVTGLPEERLPPATEATAYFTVAEALTNIAKYAEASHVTVRMEHENGVLAIEVEDDGIGGARATPGSGLSGLADRVGAVDGILEVVSPPGDGTLVRAELPLER